MWHSADTPIRPSVGPLQPPRQDTFNSAGQRAFRNRRTRESVRASPGGQHDSGSVLGMMFLHQFPFAFACGGEPLEMIGIEFPYPGISRVYVPTL